MTDKKAKSSECSADELERRKFTERFVTWWNEGAEKSRRQKAKYSEEEIKRKAA